MTSLERYHYRKGSGLCPGCGRGHDGWDGVYCPACRQQRKEYEAECRETSKRLGICLRCGRTVPDGRCLCAECRKGMSERGKARRDALKAAGICVVCGKEKAARGRVACAGCAARDLRNRKEQRGRCGNG